eukprot:COSAG01_NODE_253_length_20220_cov_22.308196_11_plen_82_part_00
MIQLGGLVMVTLSARRHRWTPLASSRESVGGRGSHGDGTMVEMLPICAPREGDVSAPGVDDSVEITAVDTSVELTKTLSSW